MTDPNQPETPAPAPESGGEAATEGPARKPRRRRSPRLAADASEQSGAPSEHPEGAGGVAPASDGGSASSDAAPSDGGDAPGSGDTEPGQRAAGEAGEGRRKRPRNRRRNRRGGARGVDGLPDSPEMPQAAEVAPVPAANLPPTDVNDLFADVVSGLYDVAAEADPAADVSVQPEPAGPLVEASEPGALLVDPALAPLVPPPEPASSTHPSENAAAETDTTHDTASDDEVSASNALPAQGGQQQPGADQTPRRVLAPEPEAPKLQKVLAQAGVGSRRDLEQMITDGRVVVNGQPAHIGQRIRMGDRITLDGKPVRVRITPSAPRVLAYHKPVGEVVTHDDPQARPTVFRRLPRLQHGKWQSVGRLDINTEGLLLFTNSGDLANRLMHPRFGVEREYAVRVLGTLTDDERERLLQGVEIEGQPAAFRSIADGGGEGVNHWYRVVITEGRNREVRKLFDTVGKAVSRLIRIRYGSVVLPRGLRRGVWVDLGADDLKALLEATGMPPRGAKPQREPRGEEERRGGRRDGRGRNARRGETAPPTQGQGQGRGQGPGPRRQAGVPDYEGDEDIDHIGPIPNPLQQTYDKRAFQQSRQSARDYGEDGPIPNPLQQTYDKRAIQNERRPQREFSEDGPIPNPLQQTYDKRFAPSSRPGGKPGGGGGGGGGARRKAPGSAPRKNAGGGGQPDPMRTAVGYIGGDAFHNKSRGGGGRGKGGPKPGGGGGGGGGRGRGGKGR